MISLKCDCTGFHQCVEISIALYDEIDVDISRERHRNYINLFLLGKDKTFLSEKQKSHQKWFRYKTGFNLEYPT